MLQKKRGFMADRTRRVELCAQGWYLDNTLRRQEEGPIREDVLNSWWFRKNLVKCTKLLERTMSLPSALRIAHLSWDTYALCLGRRTLYSDNQLLSPSCFSTCFSTSTLNSNREHVTSCNLRQIQMNAPWVKSNSDSYTCLHTLPAGCRQHVKTF